MRSLTFTIIFIWYSGIAFAQQNQIQPSKLISVSFIRKDGSYTSTLDSADYVREINEPDSGSTLFNVSERYKNGKQKLLGKSSSKNSIRAEGKYIYYFPSGVQRSIENYIDGKQVGLCYFFFPNGKFYSSVDFEQHSSNGDFIVGNDNYYYLFKDCRDSTGKVLAQNGEGRFVAYDYNFKYIAEEGVIKAGKRDSIWTGQDENFKVHFTEQFADGKLITAKSTDSAGNEHIYFARMIDPQYEGGESALIGYLSNNIVYPTRALRNHIQGTVMLSFFVMRDGSLKNIKVIKSVDEQLDMEAMSVLSRMRGWKPAVYYGMPVDLKYRLPVTFSLR